MSDDHGIAIELSDTDGSCWSSAKRHGNLRCHARAPFPGRRWRSGTPGNAQVALSWDAPASDSGVTRHEFRYKTSGDYQAWRQIANSAVGGANQAEFTVPALTNEVAHTFELRAVSAGGNSAAAQAG